MDRPNEIQLLITDHSIDAAQAASLLCPAGNVLVEMLPAAHAIRNVLLPDRVAERFRPDVGVVLGCGSDVTLEPCQLVGVRAYDGQWIEGFAAGGYRTENQVRVYGKATPNAGVCVRTDWATSIPIVILPEEDSMVATHNNLIVRRDAPVRTEGPLDLPDHRHYRTGLATVESIGPKCDLALVGGEVKVGGRIHYDTRGELEFAFGGDPDLAVIPDVAVNFVIAGGEE